MTVTSGSITIKKDDSNLIGISIGGGAPHCPCLYVVQVWNFLSFDSVLQLYSIINRFLTTPQLQKKGLYNLVMK
jgi:hypothetical protein